MIGVIANPDDRAVVSEFFQLFKTPWEFYQNDGRYEVLLCATDSRFDESTAKLVLIYAGHELPFDAQETMIATRSSSTRTLLYKGVRVPVYGENVTFRKKGTDVLVEEQSQQPAMYQYQSQGRMVAHIGYDLFSEVRTVLTTGQPAAHAAIPTLDLHISLLRDLIVASGASLVEIPPIPEGYKFIACLTHDVDHPSIRRHGLDHTTLGFLYRATLGSLFDLLRGRISIQSLLANWAAVVELPFVYMGIANDFWSDFDDRYLQLEKGLPSTFFVIPFKGRPGKNSHKQAPRFRAACYGAQDITDAIRKVMAAGCEVGLHGIDAWADPSRGREEVEEIRRLTGVQEIGVRMHWLYYDQQSPEALERAGADYDSTIGYNETVGYRAGTTQVYRPLTATRLLELPLHVMDTALFYQSYLGLSPKQATTLLSRFVDNSTQFGGCLTINWHDRSLAPERLWGVIYRDLLQQLKDRGAWFATAGEVNSWFRKRRSAEFEKNCIEPDGVRAKVKVERNGHLPGLQLRIHNACKPSGAGAQPSNKHVDLAIDENVDKRIPCSASR
jgi:hypothetical protein